MSDAILLLRIEHDQTSDILDIIDDQLASGDELDLDLIRSVVEYLRQYPDQCHHPVEDLVFRFVKKRNPDRSVSVEQILRDHESLAENTRQVYELVESTTVGHAEGDAQLRDILRKFVDTYRAHMSAEEDYFFPLALETLQSVDWAEIEYALFEASDPLYDNETEQEYRLLRQQIEERAVTAFQRGARLRETRKLGQLTSIETFNETMRKMRSAYRLVEHPEGSFGLELEGDTVIDIPKCSPARAAWCAYFHVSALGGTQAGKAVRA